MAKFKNFMAQEQIGLGNLGPKIDQLINSKDFNNQLQGAFVGSDVNGTEQADTQNYSGHIHSPANLPTDLTIPTTVKSGRILKIEKEKNPIVVRLSDGTTAAFTYDEFKKIKGSPQVGKIMSITLQRNPGNKNSQDYSQIQKVTVGY